MKPKPTTVRAGFFVGYDAFLAERGVDFNAILLRHRIDPKTFDPTTTEISFETACALFDAAAVAAKDPCLALVWCEKLRFGATGVFGQILKHSRTLEEALQSIARFLPLVINPSRVAFNKSDDTSALTWHMPAVSQTSAVQFVIVCVGVTALRLRLIAGQNWTPFAVNVAVRDVPCKDALKRVFGCRVNFQSAANEIIVDTASLGRISTIADPELSSIVKEAGEKLLRERETTPFIINEVQRAILNRLDQGKVSLEDIADELKVPARTLQSRLSAAGVTYESILRASRIDLATGYMRDTDLPLSEIALLLGFSELSAFTRAASKWFGISPRIYRENLRISAQRS
jgi:AraC-like DNA-binding protein